MTIISSTLKESARLFDIFGELGKHHDILMRTDLEAIEKDWIAVGNDLRISIKNYEQEKS